jgi:glycosyltransferase involved in cell wall biosynthesis
MADTQALPKTLAATRPGRRVLFLNHAASRNGASILLLHLLQWLRQHSDLQIEVISEGGGPLIDEFRAVATTHVWRNPLFFLRGFKQAWATGLRAKLERFLLRAYVSRRHCDLVYANTAALGQHVQALQGHSVPVLWHIHELDYALKLSLGASQASTLLATPTRVVAVSQPVVDALHQRFVVAADRIDLVHGFVPQRETSAEQGRLLRQRVLAEMAWPADAFVVAACGGLGWRKGSDLFLQLARRLIDRDQARAASGTSTAKPAAAGNSAAKLAAPRTSAAPAAAAAAAAGAPLRFLWVGGPPAQSNEADALQWSHDLQALGLQGLCARVASTADVDDYYAAMDVFALTSREDPFPLVMLEAGVHAVPTVCFAGAGGGAEFVLPDAGLVVPYLDLEAFANAVQALRAAPAQRQAMGAAAQDRVRRQHGVQTQGPRLLRSIERCLRAD